MRAAFTTARESETYSQGKRVKGVCQELSYLQEQLATSRGAEPRTMTGVFFWV